MEVGDLLWQRRRPGGVCIFLGETEIDCMGEIGWAIFHPEIGYLEDNAYYYHTLEEELAMERNREEKWRFTT